MELVTGVATVQNVDDFLARLGAIGDEHGVTVQAFDARYVVDRAHLERAVELADRAIDREENVADDRAVEILCYAAGRRQISRALTMGVDAGEGPVVILVDGTDGNEAAAVDAVESLPALATVETLGEYDSDLVREFFGVGDAELATVEGDLAALVRERVALLDVEK